MGKQTLSRPKTKRTADFSLETMQARRQLINFPQVLKDSPYIQVYTQQQCFKNKGKIKTFPDTHAKNPPPADENLKMSEAVSQVEANDDRCISGTTEMDKEHQKW